MTTIHAAEPTAVRTPAERGPFHEDAGPYRNLGDSGSLVAMGFAMTADVLLAKNTFDVAARDAEYVSWIIAFGVAVAAVFIAFAAGKERRKGHRATHRLYVALWLALGAGMAVLRFAEALMEGYVEAGEMLLAAFIFVLYLVAGAKLMQTAYDLTNPKRAQLAAARRAERKASRKLQRVEASYARVHQTLAEWHHREEALTAAADSLKDQAATHGFELKQRARNEVAAKLGRVESTGVYRQETWPERRDSDHPDPEPSAAPAAA